MSISFKYIIHKVDKLINPKKYYTNNITKKIKTLTNGDKMYALYLPNIEHMSIYTSLSALTDIELTTTYVKYARNDKVGDKKLYQIVVDFDSQYYNMVKALPYIECGTKYTLTITIPQKDAGYYPVTLKKYDGFLILTTNKNTIKDYIKTFADTIKYRISSRLIYNEQNDNKEWIRQQQGQISYGQQYVINFKQQYAKIIHKLLLM
jgi:hypothetical protein